MKILFIFLIIIYIQKGFIRTNNKSFSFIDFSGRTIIFHGVNAVYKIFPYIPNT